MTRRFAGALGALALVGALAACGGSGSSATSPGTTTSSTSAAGATTPSAATAAPAAASAPTGSSTLSVAADPSGQLRFTQSSLSARAGTVKITFTNAASFGHNLTVEGPDGQVLGATPTFEGGGHTLALHLKPGTYTYFCSVPGHRAAGMQGTLIVR